MTSLIKHKTCLYCGTVVADGWHQVLAPARPMFLGPDCIEIRQLLYECDWCGEVYTVCFINSKEAYKWN